MNLLGKLIRYISIVIFTAVGLLLVAVSYWGMLNVRFSLGLLVSLFEGVFLLISAYILRKNKRSLFPFVMISFVLFYIATTTYRFLFVTNGIFEKTDIANIPYYLAPILLVGGAFFFEKAHKPNLQNSNSGSISNAELASIPPRVGIKQGWIFFKNSVVFIFKHPSFLVPLFFAWVIFASIVLFLRYYWTFPHNFWLGLGQFLLFIFVIAYTVCLANLTLLELIKQHEEKKNLSFLDAFSRVISFDSIKVIPLAAFFAIVWFLIIVLRALTSRRKGGNEDAQPSMRDAATTLAGISDNPFSWVGLGLSLLEKLLRMTVFLALPAICWSGQNSFSAFKKAVSIIKQHPIQFLSSYALTGVAGIIMALPLIPIFTLDEAHIVIPNDIWLIVIIYEGLIWTLGVYLEQMNVAMLYSWHLSWENEGSVGDLSNFPKHDLLEDFTTSMIHNLS